MLNTLAHDEHINMGSLWAILNRTHGNSARGLISRVGGVNNRYAVVS